MPFVVATYVYASSQGQRTHSARTNVIDGFTFRGKHRFSNVVEGLKGTL